MNGKRLSLAFLLSLVTIEILLIEAKKKDCSIHPRNNLQISPFCFQTAFQSNIALAAIDEALDAVGEMRTGSGNSLELDLLAEEPEHMTLVRWSLGRLK